MGLGYLASNADPALDGKLNLVASAWFTILASSLSWIMPGINAVLARFTRPDLVKNAPWIRALPWIGLVWLIFAVALYWFAGVGPIISNLTKPEADPLTYLNGSGVTFVGIVLVIGIVWYAIKAFLNRRAGVENREVNGYPVVLGKLLGGRFEVRNLGVSGATLLKHGDLSYWNLPQFGQLPDFAPQVVVLALGTNDSKPQNWKYGGEFAGDLRDMLDHFTALPSRPKVWVCLPPPVYESRWGINEETLRQEIIPAIRR